jgi:hypothetical protein
LSYRFDEIEKLMITFDDSGIKFATNSDDMSGGGLGVFEIIDRFEFHHTGSMYMWAIKQLLNCYDMNDLCSIRENLGKDFVEVEIIPGDVGFELVSHYNCPDLINKLSGIRFN